LPRRQGCQRKTPVDATAGVYHSIHETLYPIKSWKVLEAPAAMMMVVILFPLAINFGAAGKRLRR
jgi:hypothetical protein